MMEQAHAGEGHDHVLLIAFLDDQVITDGAAGLCDVLDTGGKGTLDVIAEGEECVAAQCNIAAGCQPCLLIAFRQPLGLLGEVVLPDTVSADIKESAQLHGELLDAIIRKDENASQELAQRILTQGITVLQERYD